MFRFGWQYRSITGILLLILCGAGCAVTDFGQHDGGGSTCASPQVVSSTDELIQRLAVIEWTPVGGYSSHIPSVSHDMFISGVVRLAAQQIPVPQSCLTRHDCRHEVLLTVASSQPEIECQANDMGGCHTISLTDTTVRFRGIMRDTHPSRWNFSPVLEIISACSTPCSSSEFRCATDNTCWSSFDAYCRLCGGQSKEACACQSAEGVLPDGSDCHFWMSGDVIQSGTCQAGICR